MGKDLHRTILPFIMKAISNHNKVKNVEVVNDPDFYILKVIRKQNFRDLYVILSDDYFFGDYSAIVMHSTLKNGGFILIARPETDDYDSNEPENKIGIGKIKKLLGALHLDEYWTFHS
ncbi:hypothetical protein HUW51_02590 [Adhaeribacter swui]|uniref:Uncharacterized protein n=1 Tax=Adhaeribacter swui TaxID=2086471 RepID=A0A7G7G3D2_9BACT|nr:hypothetical protein [Adhaeribacter swui]QNF31666.1 hypothetical protein HUW51_02590 [Adhaeribacter swui]